MASPAVAGVPRTFWGVVLGTPAPSTRDFEDMRKAKVGTLRLTAGWALIQQRKGTCTDVTTRVCDWSALDYNVAGAAEQHIQVLLTIGGIPNFISGHGGKYGQRYDPLANGAGKRGWTNFVTAAAKRYGAHGTFWSEHPDLPYEPIRLWQVWNEQNSSNMFRPKPSPSRYGALVKLTSSLIKGNDPKAQIILGGMFGTPGGAGAKTITAWDFLDELYKVKGAANAFDAVALHPYSPTIKGIKYQLVKLRKAMAANHDSSGEIWLTELGWGSDAKHVQTANGLVKTPKQQAQLLTQSFKLLRSHRSSWNIAGLTWYSLRDAPEGAAACNFCASSGLVKENYKPKPAWYAYLKFSGGHGNP